jgi:nucleoside-diphosphate-sugar epimerase
MAVMKVAITGATGFVGRATMASAKSVGFEVIPLVRTPSRLENERIIGEINSDTDWANALSGVDVVVHLAAKVHVMAKSDAKPLAEFEEINTRGSINMIQQAITQNVKRIVFVSTIKVLGEQASAIAPFTSIAVPAPKDPYAISKYRAEKALRKIASESGIELAIVRPPLVYGANAKGNFKSIVKLVARGFPMPFGSLQNHRSLINVENLADFLVKCVSDEKANNGIFQPTDGEYISTSKLVRQIALAQNKRALLVPVPVFIMKLCLSLIGKSDIFERMAGDLCVDPIEVFNQLSWIPPYSFKEAIERSVSLQGSDQ